MTILCYLNNSKNVRGEKCEKRLVKENWAETKSNFVLVCTCQKVALLSYFPLSVTALVFDLEQSVHESQTLHLIQSVDSASGIFT